LRYAKPPRNADFLRPDRIRQSPSAKLMISLCSAVANSHHTFENWQNNPQLNLWS